jgi:hypothetical protein
MFAADDDAVTICTVVREDHRPYFQRSVEAVMALAGASNWTWLVVDNSGQGLDGFFPGGDARFVPVQGADRRTVAIDPGSYHHAAGLHAAIPLVRTRFLLILDPDFYVVRRRWLAEVPAYMRHRGLAFFGVTWHPRMPTKYRYFPAVHCMFVDATRVPLASLDFTPVLRVPSSRTDLWSGLRTSPRLAVARWLWRSGAALGTRRRRRLVGASRDTGTQVFERFSGRRDLAWETTQAVVRFDSDFEDVPHLTVSAGRFLERFFPESLRYLPGRPHYYATRGFLEHGWPDAARAGWEEHVWRGEPFGVHVRKGHLDRRRPQRDRREDLALVQRILDAAVASDDGPTAPPFGVPADC